MRLTAEERANLHKAYYDLAPPNTLPSTSIGVTAGVRHLIGQSSVEEKREHARHRREETARQQQYFVPLYRTLGFMAEPSRLTPAQEKYERDRRAKRKQREQRDTKQFDLGRVHERALLARLPPPVPSATRRLTPEQRARRLRLRSGDRAPRDEPLTVANLYVGGLLPPVEKTTRAHQECSLCGHVKCHPVSYICRHSNCYACIRLHLETEWTCPHPQCGQIMQQQPRRHAGEEESIRLDYPNWANTSQVLYSFEGLTFPVIPKKASISDSE
ncbi:hypothetical protein C8R43DRAFT_1140476 [Mycena crocata]|nr:hypothetical protein C8R43DRAFT_1140476 [Mycena crocata]